MGSGKKVLFALVAGAAIGAAIGVLFAPEKGEKTRKKLKNQAKKAADTLKKKATEMDDEFASELNK